MYPEEKTVTLRLGHTHQIDLSIEAVQRALDGKPVRGVDIAPLMGVISILEGIRDYKPNSLLDRFDPSNNRASGTKPTSNNSTNQKDN